MLTFSTVASIARRPSQLIWRTFGELWHDVYSSRIVIFSIVVVFYLLHSGQGEELTSSLVLVPSSGSWLLFVSIAAWAAQCWLWARLAIALNERDRADTDATLLDEVLPLILAIIVFLIALEPFLRTEKTGVISLIGISCFCLFGGAAMWVLQPSRAGARVESSPPGTSQAPLQSLLAFVLDIRAEDQPRFARWRPAIMLSFAWSLSGLVLGAVFTLQLGKILGTLGTVFSVSSILLPVVAAAAISERRTNFPVLWAVLLAPFLLPAIYDRLLHAGWAAAIAGGLLIAVSGLYLFRNRPFVALIALAIGGSLAFLSYYGPHLRLSVPHQVTTLNPGRVVTGCEKVKTPSCVSSLTTEIDAWLGASSAAQTKKKNFVVFVAAAGGGLRAGYWTASILTRLSDCIADFREHLFAISGVSGGSLGAGLYAALLQNNTGDAESAHCPDHPITILDPAALKTNMQSQLTDFLEKDFLAPVAASLFFRDLPQALFPIQFIPDRAAILESAFDKAWSDSCALRAPDSACRNLDQFSRSFFDVRSAARWTPLLFLNGTHEETGKRVITSQVRIDQETFSDAFDFFDLVGRDVSLSTAVMNSARFPFVSPAGALAKSDPKLAVRLNGHIIDGGFFENNGATTLQEVVEATMSYLRLKHKLEDWRPLVIEIVNDVEAQEADLTRSKHELFPTPPDEPLELASKPYEQTEIADQLFSAVTGLYATRTARGILASKMLSVAVKKIDGEFVQFRLCPHMRPSPPLGWLLTEQSRRAMDQLILGLGRSEYQERYADYLDGNDLAEFKNCFDDVQQALVSVQNLLAN